MAKESEAHYSNKEAAKRRDEALKRALNTPPKPFKAVKVKPKTKSQPPRRQSIRAKSD